MLLNGSLCSNSCIVPHMVICSLCMLVYSFSMASQKHRQSRKMDQTLSGRTDLLHHLVQGFGYVKFSHSASAMAALEQLNGLEFPPASGHYLKVQSQITILGSDGMEPESCACEGVDSTRCKQSVEKAALFRISSMCTGKFACLPQNAVRSRRPRCQEGRAILFAWAKGRL